MKILITGGAGFIASHVADSYIKAGHKVAIIDNLQTGYRKNVSPKAKFYKADIRNPKTMDRILRRERPEVLNHHAALINVVESLKDPYHTLETNVLGAANLLAAFGNHGKGKRKFIFSSTGGAIYGEPKKIPADESTPTLPLSSYGLSKLLGEELIKFYARQHNFDYLIFRYPNVYGPRQNPKGEAGVVAVLGGLMKQGIRPVIFGDGTKSRDYVYVGDIARANLIALRRGKNEILNLGWGKKITDQTVFDAIARAINFKELAREKRMKDAPIYAPCRKGEVHQISLDARRAEKILGWKPEVPFGEGVRKTLRTIKC